ncbi:DUF1016 N-terminal domain-containing protein [Planctomicrobium piriforme]|uniref:YhcG N-terminal domain-containing protein n=1 Tax=Planctomicrobium piriforme TaxID=1576369 RepID=A0A1I3RX68_9PLAN|nr:DUF1016 N-terminal domain-containing protein [Planctomicrobium piriforme]SFJ50620.1 Protein of unknown function [Planctomicrobium piriforme]
MAVVRFSSLKSEAALMARKRAKSSGAMRPVGDSDGLLGEIVSLLEADRRTSARAGNAVMTATYWEIGRRIVEFEQRGAAQAEYGQELVKRLAADLTQRCGRGFSWWNVDQMRAFHLAYLGILQTASAKMDGIQPGRILPTPSAKFDAEKAQTLPAQSAEPHLFHITLNRQVASLSRTRRRV